MKAKLILGCMAGLFCMIVIMAGCSKEKAVSDEGSDELAGKVGDWTLTREKLDLMIDNLPDHQKTKYASPEGKAELVGLLIEEEMYHQEALKRGFRKDERVQELIDNYTRSVLVGEYYNRVVQPMASPTEQEVHDYYEANHERYTKQPIVRAQHIFSVDRDKLVDLKKQIADGEPMTTLAHKFSEDDVTRADGGNLGYFNPGGYIRGIGYSKELSEAAFSMQKGEVSDPIKWQKGYSLLRVNEIRPAELRHYDEVKEEIKQHLIRQRIDGVKRDLFDDLKEGYDIANFLADELMMTERTPEELWNLAQTSTDSHQRIRHYEQIVNKYPDSKYAAEALFMIGFVYAEELKSMPDADRALNRVLDEYPQSEVAKTAQWMLENLNKPLPEFEDLDDLNEQIEQQSE
ncbi:MAG: peptidyl-prolyl cis-trans isomerase [Candidatus Latescibacterota bacterium]|nr:MAG: peptidyl-prolyl cis-trans isomerase [Candidatus Latescibacterota bacterium]